MGSYWHGTNNVEVLTKSQVEVICLRVKGHIQITKNKKVEDLSNDQQELLRMINGNSRDKIQELLQVQKIIFDLRYIEACSTLICYATLLKNNADKVVASQNNIYNNEWISKIASLVYATPRLNNINSMNQFKQLMTQTFGSDMVDSQKNIEPHILDSFRIKSTKQQINQYFLQFSQRNNVSLQKINSIGHNVSYDRNQRFSYPYPTVQLECFWNKNQVNINQNIPNPEEQSSQGLFPRIVNFISKIKSVIRKQT